MVQYQDGFGNDATSLFGNLENERDRLAGIVKDLQRNIVKKDTEIIALRAKLKATERQLAKAKAEIKKSAVKPKPKPKPVKAVAPKPAPKPTVVKRKPKKEKRDNTT